MGKMATALLKKTGFGVIQVASVLVTLAFVLVLRMGYNTVAVYDQGFTDPTHLAFASDDYMHLGFKVRGIELPDKKDLRDKAEVMLSSVIGNSKTRPIHFVMMTDELGIPAIADLLKNISFKHPESEYVVEYVDINLLKSMIKDMATPLRDNFNHWGISYKVTRTINGRPETMKFDNGAKYNDDLFLLGTFYHRLFTNLNRIVVLDLDMKFMVDPAQLYAEFDHFQGENIIGVTTDQTPYYYKLFSKYRDKHPGTHVGSPGRFQGLNIGVLMLDLKGVRASAKYKHLTSKAGVEELVNKYDFHVGELGDQDWLTLVSVDAEELIYPLSCRYNRQVHNRDAVGFFADVWPAYHECGDAFVAHANGGGSIEWYEANRDIAHYREKKKEEKEKLRVKL